MKQNGDVNVVEKNEIDMESFRMTDCDLPG